MAEDNRNKPLYMISVAAELTGMHPQTLRVYESKGLVNPQRSGGNTRLYSRADIERLELINQLTDEGINLAGVVRILDMKERAEERERENEKLRARVRQLEDELHEYKMQKKITALAPARRLGRTPSKSCASCWAPEEICTYAVLANRVTARCCRPARAAIDVRISSVAYRSTLPSSFTSPCSLWRAFAVCAKTSALLWVVIGDVLKMTSRKGHSCTRSAGPRWARPLLY